MPVNLDTETLNKAILSKRDWILKQIAEEKYVKPEPIKSYISGEELLFKGKIYFLCVNQQESRPNVSVNDETSINLFVKPGSDINEREKIITAWYRRELKQSIRLYITKWEAVMGVSINEFGVRKMKTRWGSCNILAKRIWLNLDLIKLRGRFLEYVLVHEMAHLLETSHNARFNSIMDQFIPDWRTLKKQLDLFKL